MKSITKKKEILTVVRNIFSNYDLEGDINDIAAMIKNIPNILAERSPEFKNAHRFSIDVDSESDYGSDDSYTVYHLHCYRWETDIELATRLKLNKEKAKAAKEKSIRQKEAKEKREKTIYENLKKKFDKK